MINNAAFAVGTTGRRELHQGYLMIVKKFIEVQYALSPMRERNCLSVEEAHVEGPSMILRWCFRPWFSSGCNRNLIAIVPATPDARFHPQLRTFGPHRNYVRYWELRNRKLTS